MTKIIITFLVPACSINMLCNPEEKPLVVPDSIKWDDLRLTPLRPDGKVILRTTEQNINQVYDDTIKDVTNSCIKVAHYYSDKLYEHKRALVFTEFALRVNPDESETYHYAAQIFCRLHNYEEALKLLDMALEETATTSIMFTRASVLGGLGRFDEAIEQYRETLAIDPKSPDVNFNLACCLITAGQYEEGWFKAESRYKLPKIKQFLKAIPNLPIWNGENLDGKENISLYRTRLRRFNSLYKIFK